MIVSALVTPAMMQAIIPSLASFPRQLSLSSVERQVQYGSSGMMMMMGGQRMPAMPFLTEEEVATLHSAIVSTLREAVDRSAGLAAADLKGEKKTGLRVHGKAGQPCPVCGSPVSRATPMRWKRHSFAYV